MSFSLGIVGLPNVGKSTLFKALTKKPIDIANYPFCTIDPNVGVVEVPDERLMQLAKVSNSKKVVPTTIEFYDIAGLVKDAHKGEGLGNKFLAHIREVKAIVHVLRGFTDSNIIHVSSNVDPVADEETINLELIFADQETVARRITDEEKKARGQDKTAAARLAVLQKLKIALDNGRLANSVDLNDEEKNSIKDLNLLTSKPIITVINVDESDINKDFGGKIPICAKIEAELAELADDEAKTYLKELGMQSSGLEKLIKKSYEILGLITFLTSGPEESRAWTVSKGAKAPQAAGVIHTDFETGFIKAEVINWQDFVKYGEAGCKEKGLMRLEGKDYVVQDGDTMYFHHH